METGQQGYFGTPTLKDCLSFVALTFANCFSN